MSEKSLESSANYILLTRLADGHKRVSTPTGPAA